MKYLLSILLSAMLIAGCGKDNKGEKSNVDSTAAGEIVTVKDDNPPASVELKYAMESNGKYRYKLTSETTTEQTVKADSTMTIALKEFITYIIDCDVREIDQDSVMEVRLVFSSVKIDAESGPQKFSYESGKPVDSTKLAEVIQYESFINNPFSARISPTGEIVELYRTDKIINKFLELQKAQNKVTPEQKAQIQMNLNEGMLKPIIQQIFRKLPEQTLTAQSKWQDSKPTKLGAFDVTQKVDYNVTGFEKMGDQRLIAMASALTIDAQAKAPFTERGVKYTLGKPKAEGSGKVYFNITKGCLQKSESLSHVEMNIQMEAPKGTPGPSKATRKESVVSKNIVQLL
jgi:hypothetical protein